MSKETDPLLPQKTYELESSQKKEPWPKSVFFIISNEFCERFTFYGMRTILVLYFTQILEYSDNQATQAFHIFAMACYFTPVIGAIIADSLIGKFWTILSISCVYSLGSIVLSIASIHGVKWLTFIGLGLIAFGTGGIKPCVSAFGGDQFKPSQTAQLATFFSLFYVSINAGSLISTSITPILRSDVECFDKTSCYPLAFGVPAILMIVAVGFFVLGKFLTNYIIFPPGKGNVFVTVCKILGYSLTHRSGPKREHWLDYADSKYDLKTIQDCKVLMQILYLYIPLPIFWALFDQQSSRWTLQAVQMDGKLGGWAIKPDQIQVINPLLVIGLVPVFEWLIYPLMDKYTNMNRPLRKMVIGGFLAAFSFVICGFIQISIEKGLPNSLTPANTHVGIINNLDCSVKFNNYDISPNEFGKIIENQVLNLNENILFNIYDCKPGSNGREGNFSARSTYRGPYVESLIFYLTDDIYEKNILLAAPFDNILVKPESAGSNMFVLFDIENFDKITNETFTSDGVKESLKISQKTILMNSNNSFGNFIPYEATVTNKKIKMFFNVGNETQELNEFDLKQGGAYISLLKGSYPNNMQIVNYKIIVKANTVSVFLQLIQYFVITAAEIMFSITGLEFSYSQAPKSMKSVIQACWLLTVAFGNLLVAVIAELSFFKSQSGEFFFFAVLMAIDIVIFAIMARYYKTISLEDSDYLTTNNTELDSIDRTTKSIDLNDKHNNQQ